MLEIWSTYSGVITRFNMDLAKEADWQTAIQQGQQDTFVQQGLDGGWLTVVMIS